MEMILSIASLLWLGVVVYLIHDIRDLKIEVAMLKADLDFLWIKTQGEPNEEGDGTSEEAN